jgi:hypothetical protein
VITEREREKRTRRRAAAEVSARRRACIQELNRIVSLADDALTVEMGPFVFQCPRCAQKMRVARIRITQTRQGPAVQHELPVCDAFYDGVHKYIFKFRPMRCRVRVYELAPEVAAAMLLNPGSVIPVEARPLPLPPMDESLEKGDPRGA